MNDLKTGFCKITNDDKYIYLETDILGIKQLYYNVDTLSYSESLNDLITNNNRDKIYFSNVLKFGYNYDNRTPYENIKRVLPNEIVMISKSEHKIIKEEKSILSQFKNQNFDLKNLIIEKVKMCLKGIPENESIGVLLSGGIDSSIISAILLTLKKENYFKQNLRFFSINNSEDEEYIKIFEERFNIKSNRLHYDLSNLDDAEKIEVLKVNESPIDLGSLFPGYLMFKELKKYNINYVFTGDGPDELFGGYRRIDEYDSQLSDIFYELSFYHFPRLNKLAKYFHLELKCPWCDEDIVNIAVNLPFEKRLHKRIMKESFVDLIPEEIINREKRPLKNDVIKADPMGYRKKLVNLFYKLMD